MFLENGILQGVPTKCCNLFGLELAYGNEFFETVFCIWLVKSPRFSMFLEFFEKNLFWPFFKFFFMTQKLFDAGWIRTCTLLLHRLTTNQLRHRGIRIIKSYFLYVLAWKFYVEIMKISKHVKNGVVSLAKCKKPFQ